MSMEDTIRRFPEQFQWDPVVEHNEVLRSHPHFIICGMGGSQLGAMLVAQYGPIHNITIHKDYGLPNISPEIVEKALVILSSYSGTTEETLDAGREALARGLSIAALSTR